jgi:hypothetical protein
MPGWTETPAARPSGLTVRSEVQGVVASCLSPSVLLNVLQPMVGLALWQRPTRAVLHRPASVLLALEPFCHVAEGTPDLASRVLMRFLPVAARSLGADIALLGRLFAKLTSAATIRLRLEHVADNACRQHHVDAVRLRLLCTYAGLGTEWVDEAGRSSHMAVSPVGVFKGSAFPDAAYRVPHRSPPVEHLLPSRRSRLLLCIDEPGVF